MNIVLRDIVCNYSKKGSGYPLILLHGNGEDHHIFDQLTSKLVNYFTVYAIDSRNHGESSKTDDYSYQAMAGDIEQFIQKLGLKQPAILGFSDGAIIAFTLAIQKPSLFSKMILLGINLKPSDFKEEVYTYLLEEYKKTKDPLIKLMLEEPNININDLKDVKTPTLLVAGENDLFKDGLYQDIASIMPNAQLKIMIGHEHDSYIVGQDILCSEVLDFLK